MPQTLTLGLAQTTSTTRHDGNIAAMRDLAARAAAAGCDLLALPEAAGLMCRDRAQMLAQAREADADPFIAACREAASRHRLWLHTGSTPVKAPDGRLWNHATLIDAEGAIRAEYDKIHLFDVFLEGEAPTGESRRYAPGETAVLVDTPWGGWGMSICYDLRFPQLYRAYAQAGAGVMFVPSAFTVPTGRAHWEVLLRARAIETGAFVVAPAQVGRHDDGRETWGHALAVDPWGEVLADLGGGEPGLAVVALDLGRVTAARRQIPSLAHDRPFTLERRHAPLDLAS